MSVCNSTKVLGHIRKIENDSEFLKLTETRKQTQEPTKRSALKTFASMFDTQELFSPVLLREKVCLQNL